METLGQFLKRERELRGISQEDIAAFTRYHLTKIQALEEDRHELLPTPPYVKGMLRGIAKYLGLDVHEVLGRYEDLLGVQKEQTLASVDQKIKIALSPFYYRRKFLVISATVSFLILVIVVSFFFRESKKLKPLEDISLPINTPALEEGAFPQAIRMPDKGHTLSLLMKAPKPLWLKVQIDSDLPYPLNVKEGETVQLSAKKVVRFFVSEAKNLELSFDGKIFSHEFQGPHTFIFPPSSEAAQQE